MFFKTWKTIIFVVCILIIKMRLKQLVSFFIIDKAQSRKQSDHCWNLNAPHTLQSTQLILYWITLHMLLPWFALFFIHALPVPFPAAKCLSTQLLRANAAPMSNYYYQILFKSLSSNKIIHLSATLCFVIYWYINIYC